MDDLTPVTRTERLLDGEDLTPTNREEMFIKRIYDKTQEIPEPVNRKEYFLKKAGEAGGDVTVVPLSVTDNGTYSEEGKAYSPVTVEVEPPANSYQLKSITTPTSLATFEASEMPMPTLKVSVEAKQASGVPSPSNPLPISGWDEAKVSDVGKNLANFRNPTGIYHTTINSSDDNNINISASANYSRMRFVYNVKVDQTYTISFKASCTGNFKHINLTNEDGNSDRYGFLALSENETAYRMTITTDTNILCVVLYNTTAGTTGDMVVKDFQVELGSSATAFEPYNPDSYTTTISLGQTVYGGEVDVVNGILKITDGYIASYNGETLPSTWISSMDVYAEGTTPTTGAEVCYELAEPIIINLTPSLIKSLNGTNNLSVDCGEVLEGEYFKALGGE